jgi:chromosomal replication initiator protein
MSQPYSDLGSIWQSILGELEVTISGHSFKTFLKSTSLESINKNTAIIKVPNPFSSAQIKARFEGEILELLKSSLPQVTKIDYIISSSSDSRVESDIGFDEKRNRSRTKPTASQPQTNLFTHSQHLIERYNFDKFVVGSSNRLAHSAARLVAEKPGTDYNPLFLYGPAGVGKTHLMWGIYGELARRKKNLELMYITIEEFYKSFIDSVRKSEAFTNKYREVDVLFVDDIQFIKKKETTQEEFFHTFNALHQANKQIVICSDRSPKEIPELEERLRSRFEWGMVVDIQPPDLETRIAIIQTKAEEKDFSISLEIAEAIAETISTNIRELEGGFNKVYMHCELHNEKPSLDIVSQVLGSANRSTGSRRKPSPKQIIEEIAQYYGLSSSDLSGKRRSRDVVLPRQIAMYILRSELDLSFPQIGGHLGGRDHTTIMYGCDKVETLIHTKDPITQDISEMRQKIHQDYMVVS